MPGVITRNCPYCHTQSVVFTARMEWETRDGKRALFTCGYCGQGVIWECTSGTSLSQMSGDADRTSIIFGRQWPAPQDGSAPEDTPASIARYFEQGISSLGAGNYDTAGMMFRKVLETSTKLLDPEKSAKPLVKRIDLLAADGKLTADLAQRAHEIRIGGNDAAHEEEPFTAEEAKEIKASSRIFLGMPLPCPRRCGGGLGARRKTSSGKVNWPE